MTRKKWTISEKVLFLTPLLIVLVGGASIYLPSASRSFEANIEKLGILSPSASRFASCRTQLIQINLGALSYAQDYDEKYPLDKTNGAAFGWAGLLEPYLQHGNGIFHCPKDLDLRVSNPSAPNYTDYFYNSRLSNIRRSQLTVQSSTIIMGDGLSSNARSVQSQLPSKWVTQSDSPSHRHFQSKSATISGANYAFADGHVKWLQPQNVGTGPTSSSRITFSIR